MWQNRLGADPGIVGGTVVFNRELYTVVGVAPEEFTGHITLDERTDLWVPIMQHPLVIEEAQSDSGPNWYWMRVLGGLEAGATRGQANVSLRTVFARWSEESPEAFEGRGAYAAAFRPIPAQSRAGELAVTVGLVTWVGLILVIICGNLAGMVLARSATRERELAVRLALGCGRGRLVRLLMVEATVIALLGGVLGSFVAYWGTGVLTSSSVFGFTNVDLRPNGTILLYSATITLATPLIFGLIPALRFSRPELVAPLKDDSGGGSLRVGRGNERSHYRTVDPPCSSPLG